MSDGRVVSIVDDDEAVRQGVDSLLRSIGLPVAAFESAEDFLSSDWVPMTRCLILDLRMPAWAAFELQERLVEDGHGIPIIILSAHGDAEVHARALAAGAIAFLSKPVDGDTLLSMVEQALGRR